MCGIVGCVGAADVSRVLLSGLGKLEYRGYDSAGIAVVCDGAVDIRKSSGRLARLLAACERDGYPQGGAGIGHTRWATHGAPTDANSHPHASGDGRFAVVHNGIIENWAELRRELEAEGCRFESETDTEVIAHLVERAYEGDLLKAVMKAALRLRGSYAAAVVCADEPGRIVAVREASPLIVGIGAGENYFASDVTALVERTRSCLYLDDGEFADIRPDSVSVFDAAGRERAKEVVRVRWDVRAAEKGGYRHFMLKEIMEQPGAVEATIAPRIAAGRVCFDDEGLDDGAFCGVTRVVIAACGSSYYAGQGVRSAFERLTGVPTSVELASELRYGGTLVNASTLVIAVSQSGETADTVAALRECVCRGARTLAVVNVAGSTVARLADHAVHTWAGPEVAVATTKGYTTQLSVLYLIAVRLARALRCIGTQEEARLVRQIAALPRAIQQAIDLNPCVSELAVRYKSCPSLLFMGRGVDWAVALEGALKMKEISYIHAEAYAAGELKHGTIALVEEGQPVIALCCDERLAAKVAGNILEVKARGANVLAVACLDNQDVVALADDLLLIPPVPPMLSAAVSVVPLQLLAYHVARERGCDIDKPRNLAKSVTVE